MGREAEQTQLDTCLERALRGIRQVIFVTGEGGAGKSTLIDAFQHRAAMRFTARIARGQGIEDFGEKEAYYPLLEAIW